MSNRPDDDRDDNDDDSQMSDELDQNQGDAEDAGRDYFQG